MMYYVQIAAPRLWGLTDSEREFVFAESIMRE